MKPSWVSMAGGSSRLVSPANRKVSVLAALAAGLVAGAVVGAAAGAEVGAAVVGAAAAVVGAAAAGGVVGFGAAGAVVGGAGAAGWQAAKRPTLAATLARPRNRRRLSGEDPMVRPSRIGGRARIARYGTPTPSSRPPALRC